jgi:hypothetical protein
MLDSLYTIRGKGGEIRQGILTWITQDEFWFSENGRVYSQYWCKTDYWEVIAQGVKIFRI